MQRRAELYAGTLRKFIEALDGELVLAARFSVGIGLLRDGKFPIYQQTARFHSRLG